MQRFTPAMDASSSDRDLLEYLHMLLKPKQHYIDLYDRHTVGECRNSEQYFLTMDKLPMLEDKVLNEKEIAPIKSHALKLYIHFKTGERYLNKEEIIRKWMEADRKKEELFEASEAPEQIRCLTCKSITKPTFKELWSEMDKEDRVLFMYDCPNKCLPRRAFFSDGEEWRVKPNLCPRCNTRLDQEESATDENITTKYACSNCAYSKTDEYVLNRKQDEGIDTKFAEDRDRFCLTEEEGKKYQREKWQMEQFSQFMEEWKKKDEARKEKLLENPDGFHLEGKGYICQICKDSMSDDETWYDKHGLSCLLCRNARRNGIIPDSVYEDDKSWYKMWEFEKYFKAKSQTVRKYVRSGQLKGRTIPDQNGKEHCMIFLIEDNKGFLPQKPKSHLVTTDDGYSHSEYEKVDSPFISPIIK